MDINEVEEAFASEQFVFTEHAFEQMAKRQLSEEEVRKVLNAHELIAAVREGRVVVQAMLHGYLVRVFVDVDRSPLEVVTAYRTSKIEYYRRQP
jgi:hypothetical protein